MKKDKKIIIGITGGIGSGKSLFSKYLTSKGEFVLQADSIAKNLIETDEYLRNFVTKLFGSKAFLDDKRLNTKLISDLIFDDYQLYNKYIPVIHNATILHLEKLARKEHKLRNRVFIEAALIFESEFDNKLDYVVLLKSDIAKRLERVTVRDKINSTEFFKRTQFQIDPEDAEKLADFTIINDGTIQELEPKFEFILKLLKTMTENN